VDEYHPRRECPSATRRRDVGLPQPTVYRWLNLLETSCSLVRLPAYAVNRTKRLVESPRISWRDTRVALHTGHTVEWLTPDVLALPW
jgi:predicted AAA+ superfamily ATPase